MVLTVDGSSEIVLGVTPDVTEGIEGLAKINEYIGRLPTDYRTALDLLNTLDYGSASTIPIDKVQRWDKQPRKYFNEGKLFELAAGIKCAGQLQPGIVRPIGDGRFELIDGERRFRACKLAGVDTYRAFVVDVDDAIARRIVSIVSNFAREGHTTGEIVHEVSCYNTDGVPVQVIAGFLGMSPANVYNYLKLENLNANLLPYLDPPTPPDERLRMVVALQLVKLDTVRQMEAFDSLRHNLPITQRAAMVVVERMLLAGAERNPNVSTRPYRTSDGISNLTKATSQMSRRVADLRDITIPLLLEKLGPDRAPLDPTIQLLTALQGEVAELITLLKGEKGDTGI